MDPVQPKHNPSLSFETTTHRVTPRDGLSFREVLGGTASTLTRGAEAALQRLPGGPVLAAAVRSGSTVTPMASVLPAQGGQASAQTPEGPSSTAAAAGGATPSLEGSLAASQDMNLYFLQIQEAMAAENRAYTASSNVLKARHDTVKNAIGNIR